MTDYKFFRNLTPEQEEEFRQWARSNYVIGDPIDSSWHPVTVDECMNMLIGRLENVVSEKRSEMGQVSKTVGRKDGNGND
tara:strand:+ start:171 stop:410 length:240 start_codon:yes stop_codon:yes gene_type:complete